MITDIKFIYNMHSLFLYFAQLSLPSDPPLPEAPMEDYGAALLRMLLALIALSLLLWVTVWFLKRVIYKRLHRNTSDDMIQVLEKRALSPKTMLYLIEVDGEKICMTESHMEIRHVGLMHHSPASQISESLPS